MSCPSVTCCPPSPFTTVGNAPVSSNACVGAACCPDNPFVLVPDAPIPPQSVTCNSLNEFSVWFEGAPVLCESGDEDFSIWFEAAPFVEKSDTY